MAGLLDSFDSDQFRLGLGLLAAGGARADGAGFGQRLMEGFGSMDKYRQDKEARKLNDLKMQAYESDVLDKKAAKAKALANEAAVRSMFMPMSGGQAMANGQGPTLANAENIGQLPAFSPSTFFQQNPDADLSGLKSAFDMKKMLTPERKLMTVAPGSSVLDEKDPTKALYTAPDKADKGPTSVQEFTYGQANPGFNDWLMQGKKAGATNVTTKVETKMGDSLASQIGPMAKDSRIQAQGAVKMFDAAGRIDKAIESGLVSTGPFTTQVQTVKQLIQKVGGGNDEGIRQTRQVIKSLAQMAVEARKQLQGQGQVTESESAAVAKADAGDINDLTVGELKDLSTLAKRAAHYTAQSHSDLITQMDSGEATRGASKFYGVQGMDALLKHSPALPKIGGGGDVRSQADAILRGK